MNGNLKSCHTDCSVGSFSFIAQTLFGRNKCVESHFFETMELCGSTSGWGGVGERILLILH